MELFVENICLVVFLPLIVSLIIGFNFLITNRLDKSYLFLSSIVTAIISVFISLSGFIFTFLNNESSQIVYPWVITDDLIYSLGFNLDKVSSSFLLVFCILNLLLQSYSYLKLYSNKSYTKLLLLQNLFAFAMCGLFLSPNLFQSYLFCEIIGVSCYLFLNFDFFNRDESKNAIKSFVFGRIGDLSLLFCLLIVLYFSVVYNELNGVNSVSYLDLNNIVASIYSLLSLPLFLLLSAIFLFVIVMKFMQSFVYLTFGIRIRDNLSRVVCFHNSLISLVAVYFLFRVFPFFAYLDTSLGFALGILFIIFIMLAVGNQIFIPLCKFFGWIEKYVVDTIVGLSELVIRFISFFCTRFQAGNFQAYLLYSLIGLSFIFLFVLVFYEFLIKV